jgi:hypothetical protein
MVPTPRIVTVDPTGTLARVVRAAVELLEQPIILIDTASGAEALAEVGRGDTRLLVSAVELADEMTGYFLALEANRAVPDIKIIVVADFDDTPLDDETIADSPFVYFQRPIDMYQLIRVLLAGVSGDDIFAALQAPATAAPAAISGGPVPSLNIDAARGIIDALLTDVGAMAIILASRTGEVLLERGAVGYLNREQLTTALLPTIGTTVQMGELVGGRTNTLHFYDGETYDIFVLSVGLHHFLCLVFDGSAGNRQFGAVNRFGRRAAEDLIAMLGASAFVIEPPSAEAPAPTRTRRRRTAAEPTAEETYEPIERPEIKPKEPEPLRLEPINELDPSIFDQLEQVDDHSAEDLFDPDKLAEIANESRRKDGPIGLDQAQELGIMPGLDS